MKNSVKNGLYIGVASLVALVGGIISFSKGGRWVKNRIEDKISQYRQEDREWTKESFEARLRKYLQEDKKWTGEKVEDKISQYRQEDEMWTEGKIREGITCYKEKDREWTKQSFEARLRRYLQEDKKWTGKKVEDKISQYRQEDREWTKESFEARLPLNQLLEAFNSTYQIINEGYYRTSGHESEDDKNEDKIIDEPIPSLGSAILFNDGYILTASHVVSEEFFRKEVYHFEHGPVIFDHNKLFLINETSSKTTKKCKLEKILESENLDYALLYVKENEDLSFYPYGLNLPDKLRPGMQSVAIGFPLGSLGKNIRLENLSQIDSDSGEEYLTFKSNIFMGDSGGPLFVIEGGDIKLTALSNKIVLLSGAIPTNIGYGVRVSKIIEDMEKQLKSGKLNKEIARKVRDFLKEKK